MQAYLFVHFKEKTTPDGEQVYFGLSKDGFNWEEVNNGEPILWSTQGEQGVRDFTILRAKNGKFYILATDLALARNMTSRYHDSWDEVSLKGSKFMALWESDNLVDWSKQRMIELGNEDFGCLWAPDMLYDKEKEDYVIHWSSPHRSNHFGEKGIYYTRTKDFESFEEPGRLYQKEDSGVIDSAIYESNGHFYCFLKSENNPSGIILLKADSITGPYTRIQQFDESMKEFHTGLYEAPTAFQFEDGRWCLMLDFYGCAKEEQGYVPFISDDIDSGVFVRSDQKFHFPYGFKHGTILTITMEEYERISRHYPNRR